MKTYIQLLPATIDHHKSNLFKCYGTRGWKGTTLCICTTMLCYKYTAYLVTGYIFQDATPCSSSNKQHSIITDDHNLDTHCHHNLKYHTLFSNHK